MGTLLWLAFAHPVVALGRARGADRADDLAAAEARGVLLRDDRRTHPRRLAAGRRRRTARSAMPETARPDVRQDPDRQSRRDRLPRRAHRAPHGRAHRCRLLRRRRRGAARRRAATRPTGSGPPPPRESYLDGDAIIAIARRAGAQAIHPGYGFLSENAGFAAACAAAGLVFIGPPPAAIAAMGSKSAAKTIMGAAGVPLVPGYHGDDQDAALLAREAATRSAIPVLIKATAGGGGKGMKIVERSRGFRRRARLGAARGQGGLRRRPRAAREIPRSAAAHRDPGFRRHARRAPSTCSSATARCSGATRRCSRKRRRRA